jgi:hypothetical protein
MWLHTPVIPTTQETEIKRIMVQDQPSKKLVEPYLKNKLGMVAYSYKPSYLEGRGKKIAVQV